LRAKRSNLGFKEINNFGIAASQKPLLAMTLREFFSSLLGAYAHNIDKRLSICETFFSRHSGLASLPLHD